MKVSYMKQGGRSSTRDDYEPIGAWAFDGRDITCAFLPGNEDAENEARKALIRAKERYGDTMTMQHFQYIMRTANDYTTCFTLPVDGDFASARDCVDEILRTIAEK